MPQYSSAMIQLEEFRSILVDYGLLQDCAPVGKQWEPLIELLQDLNNPLTIEEDSYPWLIDSEELIQLIKVVGGAGATYFNNAEKGKGIISNRALKKYLLLSLHKLLYLRWGLDWGLNEEEKKAGKHLIPGIGCKEAVIVEPKDALGELSGDFVKPFSNQELEALLDISKDINEAKRIQEGNEDKQRAALGNIAVRIKAECPNEVLNMSKRSRLNFIADLMVFARVNVPQQLVIETANLQNPKYKPDDARRARERMLKNWALAAKKVEEKTFYKKCQGCAELEKCAISQNLKRFDDI